MLFSLNMAAAKCIALLLLAMAAGGTHGLDFVVSNSAEGSDGGKIFDNKIGRAKAAQIMDSASQFIWQTFAQQSSTDRKDVQTVTLLVESMDGVADMSNNKINLSADYVANYQGDVENEITGVLYHEMTHVWQWYGNGTAPLALIEGIADYVRLTAGLAPSSWVKPGSGEKKDEGYDVTAYFLQYCDSITSGFVGKMNSKLRDGWDLGFFNDLTGRSVDELWNDYKESKNLTNLTAPLRSTNLTAPPRSTNLTMPPRSTNSPRPLTPLSGNSTNPAGKKISKIVPILLGSVVGPALFVMLCLVFCRCVRHWKISVRTDKNLDARGNFGQVFFDYKVLRNSTGNFNRHNMLGKGGFGEVYKGRLPDGRDVAVKKLNGRQTSQAAEEFLSEVKLISSVRHRNLVCLLGCCKRGHKRLLVYEFMSNNSLDKHLFGEIRNSLSWENRLKIILGTARGLAYLHGESNVRIIHRDIKCANILLDDRLHPKIADFGLARFFPESQTHVSTRVGGTVGYTAPEYAVHGQLTEKADVYSYGIVVLEIVSGRKCLDPRLPAPLQLLLQCAWNQFDQNDVLDIVDPLLEGQYPREQVLRVITIALLCTQGSRTQRPTMSQVVSMLTDNSESTVQPTRPAFIDVAADRPPNFIHTPESTTSVVAPTQGSHGSISVSLLPR